MGANSWLPGLLLLLPPLLLLGPLLASRPASALVFDLNKTPDELEQPEPEAQLEQLPRKRSGLLERLSGKLPKYLDFEQFLGRFKRDYERSERPARRSIFMRNALEAFQARVSFRLGRTWSLRAVNKFSDRSEPELRSMLLAGPPPVDGAGRLAFVDQLKAGAAAAAAKEAAPGHWALEAESQAAAGQQEASAEQRARSLIEQILVHSGGLADGDDELLAAIEDELGERAIETGAQAAAAAAAAADTNQPTDSSSNSNTRLAFQETADQWRTRADRQPEADRLDWSQHYCFHQVYDQGSDCGKCYVMAATALAEFFKCAAGPKLVRRKFSKDFVLDCAQKFSPTLMGCAGGSPLDTLRFLAQTGANNIREWRSSKQAQLEALRRSLGGTLAYADPLDLRCPLQAHQLDWAQWGAHRLDFEPEPVGAERWRAALQDGPLAVWIQVPPLAEFFSYSGGLHSGAGCAESRAWHAMILVGYGQDPNSGQHYWRFRNSFGPDWGDGGHFNLAQQVAGECLTAGVRLLRRPAAD